MKRRDFIKTVAATSTIAGSAGFERLALAAEPLKVGFVYVGPVGDYGWTYEHDQGRKYMAKKLGQQVNTTYVENVPETNDAVRVIRELAAKGNKLIYTTSFGYMDPTMRVARQFPKTYFESCTGYKLAHNVGTYMPRWYEARYLTGLIGGAMTKSNVIGYVAPYPIPEVIRGVNAFTIGLHQVNPKATVKVIFVNTWYDPGKERLAAETLITQGADILNKHTDSPAVIQVAAEKGAYSFGYDSNMKRFGPKSVLTSIVNDWGMYYLNTTKSVLDGTWKSRAVWDGLKTGMVQLAPLNSAIPKHTVDQVAKQKQAIEAGDFTIFKGPLKDQSGKMRVAQGKSMSDDDILHMNYFLEGVQGHLPKS